MKKGLRGKAKTIPVEAKRVARDIQRLENLQKKQLRHPENVEVLRWAEQYVKQRLWHARNMLDDVASAQRKLDPKAARVIRAYWPIWNEKGLQWGERQSEMGKLGFVSLEKM